MPPGGYGYGPSPPSGGYSGGSMPPSGGYGGTNSPPQDDKGKTDGSNASPTSTPQIPDSSITSKNSIFKFIKSNQFLFHGYYQQSLSHTVVKNNNITHSLF